jgi:hypothetical protein
MAVAVALHPPLRGTSILVNLQAYLRSISTCACTSTSTERPDGSLWRWLPNAVLGCPGKLNSHLDDVQWPAADVDGQL